MRTTESLNKELENIGSPVRALGEYVNNKTPILFMSLECEHVWPTRPSIILHGGGCKICARLKRRLTKEIVNTRLENSNRPERLIGEYTNNSTKTLFYSLECQHSWPARPLDVLNGSKCSICFKKETLTLTEIYNRLEDRNIELFGEYENVSTKMNFKCLICDHIWGSKPNDIFNGSGCPCCANYGFDPSKPAFLYYIKIIPENLFKIGITNRSLKERFKYELHKIEPIFIKYYENGQDAYNKEQEILSQFSEYRYNGTPLLETGNTEIFNIDLIDLLILV